MLATFEIHFIKSTSTKLRMCKVNISELCTIDATDSHSLCTIELESKCKQLAVSMLYGICHGHIYCHEITN